MLYLYLKSIEIKGFKSFADRIELDFNTGITAIVGPNGSGKSNISDSIRWVLGEQSAKTLRGTKMEDVIFAGTENRKPLGCAEVSLTIDNSKNELPIDFSEIKITRRLYRSGESEYLINGTPSRLKDISELFMDTGIGIDGYSLISQGKIDEILSLKSEDRRNLFEEAAGIVKYKTRKLESERKLDSTKQNIVRIDDIIKELESQIEPLSRQSETARKYLNFKEELKQLEINLTLHNYETSKQKIDSLSQKADELNDSCSEYTNKKSEITKCISELKKKLEETEKKLTDANNVRFELEKKTENLDGTSKLLVERYDNLINEKNRINEEIKSGNDRICSIDLNLDEVKKQKEAEAAQLDDKLKRLEELQNSYNINNEKCQMLESKIESGKSDQIEILKEISDVKNKLSTTGIMLSNLENRKDKISREVEVKKEKISSLESEINSKRTEFNNKNELIKGIEDEYKALKEKVSSLEENAGNLNIERNRTFDSLKTKEARYNALLHMEKEMEGYNRSVKTILTSFKDGKKVYGTISDIIEVPDGYETAIETALGPTLQNIVTDNENTASDMIDYLKRNNAGRATFLPLTTIKPRGFAANKNTAGLKGFCGIASDIVKYDAKYNNAVLYLLGRVIICDNLLNAKTIAKHIDYAIRIVTIDGDVINAGGSFTGGSNNLKNSGLITRKNEINELKVLIESIKNKLLAVEGKIKINSQEIITKKQEYASTFDKLQSENLKFNMIKNEIKSIENQVEGFRESINETLIETEQISIEKNRNIQITDKSNVEMEKLLKKQKEIENVTDSMEEELKVIRAEKEKIDVSLTDEKVSYAEMKKNHEGVVSSIDQALNEKDKYRLSIEKNNVKLSDIEERIKQNTAEKSENKKQAENTLKLIENKKEEIQTIENERQKISDNLCDTEKQLGFADEDIKNITDSLHKLEINKSKVEMEVDIVCSRLWEDYELSIAQAEKYRTDIGNIQKAAKRVNEIKQSIKDLGSVNVNSIEEHKKVTERYEFLKKQEGDLKTAENNLVDVINEMNIKMEKQFKEKFKIIRDNFNSTFKELFGGGYADLKLESDDVLNCGIEITVEPPGKKLQSLTLLSGGEKGLSAIALLFAILKMKPTPFCVLDEIEAALDDANVNRFAKFLREYSENTQFIIITHRKGSMAAADILYGVTMEEKGISKMISLKLKGGN